MNVCSLFAGIGGFDLGFQAAGIVPTVHVEKDASCRMVLRARFPHSHVSDDVRAIPSLIKRQRKGKPISDAARRLIDAIRQCGIICGGFPCQDLSVAGERAGLAGERSGLWSFYRRIVALLRPAWVVIENVPGLLSSNQGRDLDRILTELEKLGYRWAFRTLDAQFFDVPQRRERVFVVASLGNYSCAEVLFERNGVCWDTPPSREAGKEVAGTLGGSSQSGGFRTTDLDNNGAYIVGALCNGGKAAGSATMQAAQQGQLIAGGDGPDGAVTAKWAKGTGGPAGDECQNLIAHCLRGEGFDASEDGTGRGTPIIAVNGRQDPVTGAVTGALDTDPNTQCVFQPRVARNGRGNASAIAPALNGCNAGDTSDSRPCVQVGKTVRRLTPLECLRLQGFPDDWLDGLGLSDSAKYKMCGNAVNVKVSAWIAKRIAQVPQECLSLE